MRKLVLMLVLAASFGTVQLPPAAAQDTNLSCPPWTDNPIVGGQTPIRAQHINELRACLDLVLGALNAIPPPSGGSCTEDLGTLTTGQITRTGSWNGSCLARDGSSEFSRFYTFALSHDATVEGTLMSPTVRRPFMKLYRGTTHVITAAGGRLVEELSAGAYTLEANSRHRETGSYTLTLDVRGVGGPPPPPPDGKQLTVSNVIFNPDYPTGSEKHVVTGVITNTGNETVNLFRINVRFYRADGTLLREQINYGGYLGDEINPGDRREFSTGIARGQRESLGWDYFSLYLLESRADGGPVPCAGCNERYPSPPPEPCGIPFDEGLVVTRQCRNGGWWAAGPTQTLLLCSRTKERAIDLVLGDDYTPTRIGTADWIERDGTRGREVELWRTEYALFGYDNDIRGRLLNISCFR